MDEMDMAKLEGLIGRCGTEAVLRSMAEILFERADALKEEWAKDPMIKKSIGYAKLINKCAEKISKKAKEL